MTVMVKRRSQRLCEVVSGVLILVGGLSCAVEPAEDLPTESNGTGGSDVSGGFGGIGGATGGVSGSGGHSTGGTSAAAGSGGAGTGGVGGSGSDFDAGAGAGGVAGTGGTGGAGCLFPFPCATGGTSATGGASGTGGTGGNADAGAGLPGFSPSPNNPAQCPQEAPANPVGSCLGLPVYLQCNYSDGTRNYGCVCDWYHWLCV